MERNYKVGELVRISMQTGVYQIVAERPPMQVYVRRVFDKKLNFRLGKAVLYHRNWLHGISKEFKQKIERILNDDAVIAQKITDVVLDPEFNFYTWFFKKKYTPFFVIKDIDADEINKRVADEFEKNPCEKQLIKTLSSLQKKRLVKPIYTRLTSERQGLNESESVYRVECGRYENDFDEKGDMSFSAARIYKIKNTGVSKEKADYNSPIGFIS